MATWLQEFAAGAEKTGAEIRLDPVAAVYEAGGVVVELSGGVYVWPAGVLTRELADALVDVVGKAKPAALCPRCSGRSFWIMPGPVRRCATCHPAPDAAVAALRRTFAGEG